MTPLQTAINEALNRKAHEIVTERHLAIGPEKFDECYEEARPLLERHYHEIAHDKTIPLDIDVDRYRELEAKGALRIYTARVDGALVGYAVFFLSPHMHYKSTLFATEDIIYLNPNCRNSRIGVQLIKASEQFLRAEGVQVLAHHVKVAHPTLGLILGRMGYERQDVIWTKRLDR